MESKESNSGGSAQNSQASNTKDYLRKCNFGKNGGFGDQYINEEHCKFSEINQPKKDNCFFTLFVITLANAFLLYMCHYIYNNGISIVRNQCGGTILFVMSIFIYLILVFRANQLTRYIKNQKDIQLYEKDYEQMVKKPASICFAMKCYHTEQIPGRSKYHEVISHIGIDQYLASSVQDNTRMIKQIKKKQGRLVFVHNLNRFSFGNKETKEHFIGYYNQFARKNIRDKKQQPRLFMNTPDYEEYVCYSNDDLEWVQKQLKLFTLIGLAASFLIVMEFMIDRYEVKNHKILTK